MAENYITICGELTNGLSPQDLGKIQLLGGVTALSLCEAQSIDDETSTIVATPDLFLPTVRDNETKRDLDVLALTDDSDEIARLNETISGIVDNRLEVEVFGLRPKDVLERQKTRPLGFSAFKTFVSDRYGNPNSGVVKALFPFVVPLNQEALHTWQVQVGKSVLPVPAPSATVLNYTQRSIGGLRGKDKQKWTDTINRLGEIGYPLDEHLQDGAFADQARLTAMIDSLKKPKEASATNILGLPRFSNEQLFEAVSNTIPDHRIARSALVIARFKSKVMSAAEGSDRIVAFWQKHIEQRIGFVTHNQ